MLAMIISLNIINTRCHQLIINYTEYINNFLWHTYTHVFRAIGHPPHEFLGRF